jgi:nucleotide-binding universal stress UspA family protein
VYHTIAVALDRAGRGERALPIVSALARRSLAEVVLLSVRGAGAGQSPDAAVADDVARLVARLEAEGVRARAEVFFTYGRPAAGVIVDAVRQLRADLLALGSRGRGDLAGLLLGSVGHRVAARLDCPILLVHDGRPSTGVRRIRRLLLAVNDSEEAMGAIEATTDLAREHGAAVMVVHALAHPETDRRGRPAQRDTGDAVLEYARQQVARSERPVQTQLLAGTGPVAARLAEAAERWHADLIVVGSRRLTDLGGLLLGSVAHDLVRRTHRPVLLAERQRAEDGRRTPDRSAGSGMPVRHGSRWAREP